jgi:hypothetical protein
MLPSVYNDSPFFAHNHANEALSLARCHYHSREQANEFVCKYLLHFMFSLLAKKAAPSTILFINDSSYFARNHFNEALSLARCHYHSWEQCLQIFIAFYVLSYIETNVVLCSVRSSSMFLSFFCQ